MIWRSTNMRWQRKLVKPPCNYNIMLSLPPIYFKHGIWGIVTFTLCHLLLWILIRFHPKIKVKVPLKSICLHTWWHDISSTNISSNIYRVRVMAATRPHPHSVNRGIPCVFPKCPVKGYFLRTKVRLVVHKNLARIEYWLYTPDFIRGVFSKEGNMHMRTLNNTEWRGRGLQSPYKVVKLRSKIKYRIWLG